MFTETYLKNVCVCAFAVSSFCFYSFALFLCIFPERGKEREREREKQREIVNKRLDVLGGKEDLGGAELGERTPSKFIIF